MDHLTKCRNPACEFHDRCRFARAQGAGQTPATTGTQEQAPPCPRLTIASNGLGRVLLDQPIGPELAPLVNELEGLAPASVRGILIRVRSGGGSARWGNRLNAALAGYLGRGGVAASLIDIAYSCSFELSQLCTRCFILPDGVGGGIGVYEYFCDGHRPTLIQSGQTPLKVAGGMDAPPDFFKAADDAEMVRRQESLDDECEDVFGLIAAARRMGVGDVQRAMRGQAKLPAQLLAGGFVDAITTEEQAEIELWRLTSTSGRKELSNGVTLNPF